MSFPRFRYLYANLFVRMRATDLSSDVLAQVDYRLIHSNLVSRVPLNEEELALFDSVVSFQKLPKKSLLLKEGQLCNQFNYVHAGALRAYTLDKQGREATVMFALPDWWITDMYCFLNGKPAMMFIEAIEDSLIFRISKAGLDDLLIRKMPKFETFFRLLMQNAYTREQLRMIEQLTLPAEERYDAFLLKYPHIARKVTLKQVASYLGITPEFLSAIRKNKAKRIS